MKRTEMTDAQKVEALQELLNDVIHSLTMAEYDIEDGEKAYAVTVLADDYFNQMLKIVHS
jgi:hypothetical protein